MEEKAEAGRCSCLSKECRVFKLRRSGCIHSPAATAVTCFTSGMRVFVTGVQDFLSYRCFDNWMDSSFQAFIEKEVCKPVCQCAPVCTVC